MQGKAIKSAGVAAALPVSDKLYMENTLLRVSGALFCHDAKRAPLRKDEIVINRDFADRAIVIRPDNRMGQPGPLAHKIFVALLKKHSDYGRPIQNGVSFNKRELMRLVGRENWGGSDSEELARALYQIRRTGITAFFKQGDRFLDREFNVFNELLLERRRSHTDPIEACTIVLADPIVAALKDEHFICLNYTLMQQIGTIGQAVYMRLFFHFANLYDGHHQKRLSFRKHYADVCEEWLGGLKVLRYKSEIERDQLGGHLKLLVRLGFLASYQIAPAKVRDGFVLTFRPGAVFFEDYTRFYQRQQRPNVQFHFHEERRSIAEPLKLAYLFVQKTTGQSADEIQGVSSRERATAEYILTQISIQEANAFLDYALGEARKTRFEVKTLGGLKQYLPSYAAFRSRQKARTREQEATTVKEQEDRLRSAYSEFRRLETDGVYATLSKGEQAKIESLAQREIKPLPAGPLTQRLYKNALARIVAEQYPDRITSFESFRLRKRAA